MSTYWDVCCLDCNEKSGLHLNWGAETQQVDELCEDALAALRGPGMVED